MSICTLPFLPLPLFNLLHPLPLQPRLLCRSSRASQLRQRPHSRAEQALCRIPHRAYPLQLYLHQRRERGPRRASFRRLALVHDHQHYPLHQGWLQAQRLGVDAKHIPRNRKV